MLFDKIVGILLRVTFIFLFAAQNTYPVIVKATIFAKQLEDGRIKRVIVCEDNHSDFYGECDLRASAGNKIFLENFLSKAIFHNPHNPVEVLIEDVSSSSSFSFVPQEISSSHFDYKRRDKYEESSFMYMLPLIRYNVDSFMPLVSKKFTANASIINIDPRFFFGTIQLKNLQSQSDFGKYVTRYGRARNAEAIIAGIRSFGSNSSDAMLQQIFFDLSNHCQTSFNNFKKIFITDLASYFQQQCVDPTFLQKIKNIAQFSINKITARCIEKLVACIWRFLDRTNDYYLNYTLTKFVDNLQDKRAVLLGYSGFMISHVIEESNKILTDLEERAQFREFSDADIIRQFIVDMNDIVRSHAIKIYDQYNYFKWCCSDLHDQAILNKICTSNNVYDFIIKYYLNALDDDAIVPISDTLGWCLVLSESVEALALQRIVDPNNRAATFICFAGSAHTQKLINLLLKIGYARIEPAITYQGFSYDGPDRIPMMTELSLTNLARAISNKVVQWVNMSFDEIFDVLNTDLH